MENFFLTQFFMSLIDTFYGLTVSVGIPSHGLAIILISGLIKAVLFPLTRMQSKSMKSVQALQPEMEKIKKKHKNDKKKLNEEITKLYQENKVNPMASCLPLLLQFPIIIALFQAMRAYFVPELAAGFLWVPNLGEIDPWILPLLAGVSTFGQQRIIMLGQKTDTIPQQQKTMLYIMPVFMAWISRSFPAGLALYWVCFNVFGILEQLIMQAGQRTKKEPAV